MPLYRSVAELDFELARLPALPPPRRILMADPAHYCTEQALNPHMLDEHGALKPVDAERARALGSGLRARFEQLGFAVDVVPARAGLPDLVFCANQVLPIPAGAAPDGVARIVPSRMRWPARRGEVPLVSAHLERAGYRVDVLADEGPLEGMGDGLWHPGRRLLWGGVGERSRAEAWAEIARRFELPVVLLELVSADYYHLDTCLALIAEDACLWHPPALAPAARELVAALVPRRIEVDPAEARTRLACNACGPDGKHVLLPSGAPITARRLRDAGFEVIEVETGEFLKAGGSVFCMKLLH
jgi:N-dimethylarginine dimethylaminohydrolase